MGKSKTTERIRHPMDVLCICGHGRGDHRAGSLGCGHGGCVCATYCVALEPPVAGRHTPEPWSVDRMTLNTARSAFAVYAPDLGEYAPEGALVQLADYLTEADARRIVACVNACAGISTAALESMPPGFLEALRERNAEALIRIASEGDVK